MRKHQRAPMFSNVLYAADQFVHKAFAINISQGGILFEGVPYYPSSDKAAILFYLKKYPLFETMETEKLYYLIGHDIERSVFRAQIKIIRKNVSGSKDNEFVAIVHPITGGKAPAAPPITIMAENTPTAPQLQPFVPHGRC